MAKVNLKGPIISSDEKWIYDWFGVEATCAKDIEKAINNANGEELEVIINSPGGYVDEGSEILKQCNKAISNAYVLKTNLDEETLLDLMNKETYMDAQKAMELGFVDEIMFDTRNKLINLTDSGMLPNEVIEKMRNMQNEMNLNKNNLNNENIKDNELNKLKEKLAFKHKNVSSFLLCQKERMLPMSKELRELLNQLDSKNKELTNLLNKQDVTKEELENVSNEIDFIRAKVEAQKIKDNLDNEFANNSGATITNTINEDESVIYNGELFVKAIADNLLKQKNQRGLQLTEKEMNAISENIDEDGGYAVPQDIQTKINERLKDTTDLYNFVDSETVYARSGKRTYEKRSKQKPMKPLAENANLSTTGNNDNAKLEVFSWTLKDFGDFMSIPNDLLKFADKSLEDFIINWFVDKVRITRNSEILYGAGGKEHSQGILTSNKFKKVTLAKNPGLKDFKKCKNVEL